MASLTEYVESKSLQQLQDRFVAVAQVPIRICDLDDQPLTRESPLPGRRRTDFLNGTPHQANIDIGGEAIAKVVMVVEPQAHSDQVVAPWRREMLQLMAGVLGGLYDRERELRIRIEQLATLYTLTAEFSGYRELQSLLDLVARTVVKALKVKACSIRLLNETRTELVIKAVANLSDDYLSKGPILVSASKIDQEIIATGQPVYIADERTDPRVLYPAEARREGLVSALCAPMMYKGKPEGILRVYTAHKHVFDWFEESLLSAIAAQAAAAIVTARLNEEALRAAEMERALTMAGEVQRQMIPAGPPASRGLDIAAAYEPCYELGGDFYDFVHLGGENLGLVICDVAGKGVRASLLMASIRASLRAHASSVYSISDVIARVNHDLYEDAQSGDFATLFYGVIDQRSRRFTYVNAGHVPPLLFRGGQVTPLNTRGTLLGVTTAAAWPYEALTLQSGDVLLAYTDGLSESLNFNDEPFGAARIRQSAADAIAQGQSADGLVKRILWELRRFTGLQTRGDDLTILGIKVS